MVRASCRVPARILGPGSAFGVEGDDAMEPFRRLAFFTVARDAGFVTLAGATLMVGFSFEPSLAFLIGANVALTFCLGLTFRAWRLERDEARITRTEPWRVLEKPERPTGSDGRRWARDLLEEHWLRAAKAFALAAIVLAGSSLIVSVHRSRTADITPKPPMRVAAYGPAAGQAGTNLWPQHLMQI
jgi:hypothetical protein